MPITLRKEKGDKKKKLKLVLYKGQYQLAYGRVFYSDGYEYFPFRKSFNVIRNELSTFQDILVLGAGIGSIGMILNKQFPNQHFQIDYVDINGKILKWCQEVMNTIPSVSCTYHNMDAVQFLRDRNTIYDLICMDIFDEHIVPKHLLTENFVEKIVKRLSPNGIAILNIMFVSDLQEMGFTEFLEKKFNNIQRIDTSKNKIFILQKNKINNLI